MKCGNCNTEDGHAEWCIVPKQAARDRQFREHYAREIYSAMRDEIRNAIEKARADMAHYQRTGEGHLSLIRDYTISMDKLLDHINRMSP